MELVEQLFYFFFLSYVLVYIFNDNSTLQWCDFWLEMQFVTATCSLVCKAA